MAQVSRAIAKLEHSLSRSPTEEEIANALGLPLAEYQQLAMELARAPAIGRLGEHDPDDVASAALDPAALFAAAELRGHLVGAIKALPERTQQVLALYYQHDCTQAEIGKALGVTESRVCQILGEAIARLRAKLATQAIGPSYAEGED
jgi:RNA polymerase sigma factor for flagellar operon FliA